MFFNLLFPSILIHNQIALEGVEDRFSRVKCSIHYMNLWRAW